jgi:hypothetical protein
MARCFPHPTMTRPLTPPNGTRSGLAEAAGCEQLPFLLVLLRSTRFCERPPGRGRSSRASASERCCVPSHEFDEPRMRFNRRSGSWRIDTGWMERSAKMAPAVLRQERLAPARHRRQPDADIGRLVPAASVALRGAAVALDVRNAAPVELQPEPDRPLRPPWWTPHGSAGLRGDRRPRPYTH